MRLRTAYPLSALLLAAATVYGQPIPITGEVVGKVWLLAHKDKASANQTVTVPTAEPIEIVLQKPLPIVLRVLDEAGKPVRDLGYSVENVTPGNHLHGMSGAVGVNNWTGEMKVDLDGPGYYRIEVRSEGLVPASVLVEVGPEGLDAPLTVVMSAGGTVVGRVTDPEGAPLPEAEVSVATGRWYPPAKTDGSGAFRLTGVALGPRTLSASRQGYQTQAQGFEVKPGENRVDFQLVPGASVSGRVIAAADGSPLAGATVTLGWDSPPRQTASAADGSFTFSGLAPDVYQVRAVKPGFAEEIGETVSVGSAPVADVELRLHVGGSLRGQVSGLDFKALGEARVSATSAGEGETQQARPDFQGAFHLDHLAAGSWTVVAAAGDRSVRRQVEIADGRETQVELAFRNGVRLSGRVTMRGEPVADVGVSVSGLDNDSIGETRTAADGTFALPGLAAGRLYLLVQDDLTRELLERTLEIAGDREVLLELPAQRVSGRVVDSAGDPVEQAQVTVEPEAASGSPAAAISGADGRFTVQGLAPGPHRVTAGKDGFASAAARLTVPADDDVEDVELVLAPAALLTLDVVGPTGGIPGRVEAALFSADGRAVSLGIYTQSPGGAFEIRGAAPGTYRLVASTADGVAVTRVTVPGRHRVDLALQASLMVRVAALKSLPQGGRAVVLDAEGRPFGSVIAGHLEPSWQLFFGSTRLWSLPPGSWRLVVTAPEGRRWEKQVTLAAGENAEVHFE